MERIGDVAAARQKVFTDIGGFMAIVHRLSSAPISSIEEGGNRLRQLRAGVYEDLNQIQHEHMILIALEWLTQNLDWPEATEWFWNPRQTGDANEPDLRAVHEGRTLVSAEITTSEKPVGSIDTRMRSTLAKLSRMDGEHYYFVRSREMFKRANTKVAVAGWNISVIQAAM
jgi:hypothetical protein